MKRKIQIEGMKCNHCVSAIKEALETVSGVVEVEVCLVENCAYVSGEVSEEVLKEAIDDAGFDVVGILAI